MIIEIKIIFNVYKLERSLNSISGDALYKTTKIIHHEGVAIGNENNKLYFDYGVGEGNLDFRVWDSKENKDSWQKIKNVGTSNASDDKVMEIFYGPKSDVWTDHNDYRKLSHNCIHFANEKIKELKQFKKPTQNTSENGQTNPTENNY